MIDLSKLLKCSECGNVLWVLCEAGVRCASCGMECRVLQLRVADETRKPEEKARRDTGDTIIGSSPELAAY